jgi:hypothetical protein
MATARNADFLLVVLEWGMAPAVCSYLGIKPDRKLQHRTPFSNRRIGIVRG